MSDASSPQGKLILRLMSPTCACGDPYSGATSMIQHQIYAETNLPTIYGNFRVRVYRAEETQTKPSEDYEALAIISGYLDKRQPTNLRIHSACFTSEVLGSCKCDCRQQLDTSLQYIQEHSGLVIYLPQEGRGIGLADKLRVYALQEHGFDTIEANQALGFPVDARCYDAAVSILKDQGIKSVNLLTNNPDKIASLADAGVEVANRIPIHHPVNPYSANYVETKHAKMGHLI
jgi:GTP cyclohydrolase II